jgi:hypothetical protein
LMTVEMCGVILLLGSLLDSITIFLKRKEKVNNKRFRMLAHLWRIVNHNLLKILRYYQDFIIWWKRTILRDLNLFLILIKGMIIFFCLQQMLWGGYIVAFFNSIKNKDNSNPVKKGKWRWKMKRVLKNKRKIIRSILFLYQVCFIAINSIWVEGD